MRCYLRRDEVLREGLLNDEPPKDTLAKLFELKQWDGTDGVAFVGLTYAATNAGSGVTGFTHVHRDALAQYDYTVHRDHQGSISVHVHDYEDTRWPKRGGELFLRKDHVRADKQPAS